MKTANLYLNLRKIGVLYATALCLALAGAATGQQYCEITLTGCPNEYNDDTLVVPSSVLALSTKVRACGFQDTTASLGDPPAVMFIIDHSTSMDQNNINNDANGNRYRVTKALIDSIYNVYPSAQVGVIIFANGLVFKADRDANLVKFEGVINTNAPAAGNAQSYMPLLQLDKPAKTGGSNPFYKDTTTAPYAIDVYRAMFYVPESETAKSSISGGPDTQRGTDISIAFEAALEAFNLTTRKPENQYIIFLSDGVPGLIDSRDSVGCPDTLGTASLYNPRCARLNDFSKNTTGVPTTYTVFLQRQSSDTATPPPIIQDMTKNIQENDYSSNNPSSAAWALTSDYSKLLKLMMDNIVTPMLSKSSGNAKTITISSAGVKDSTGTISNGEFNFHRRLPVDTAVITPVNMTLRYDVQVDTLDTSYVIKNKEFSYNFAIRRTNNPPADWKTSQGLESECFRAPTLDLRYDGKSLVGKEVKGNMNPLQIVFDNTDAFFNYNTVVVSVLNADGNVSDLENFTLTKGSDGTWTYQFPRTIASTAKNGDSTLQHTEMNDSIILVFRNPDIPLDTIRVSVPYISNTMAFYDHSGDPTAPGTKKLADTIEVKPNAPFDIYAKLFFNGAWDKGMMNAGAITWTIDNRQSVTLNYDNEMDGEALCTFITTSAGCTYVVTATFRDTVSGVEISKKITIKVGQGESTVAIGPNPFVPGVSNIMERLTKLSNKTNVNDIKIYEDIVAFSKSGGGPEIGVYSVTGVLITATAPKQVRQDGTSDKYATATAVIYDAVGHIVFKSKPGDIVLAGDGNTVGFVWNGKNMAGRTVGPGTYLMRMTATMTKGEKFSCQRMIGVTVDKK